MTRKDRFQMVAGRPIGHGSAGSATCSWETTLTAKGVSETRKLVVHPVCSPELAKESRAFYRDVL
jgi:hypothetical protein